MRNHDLLFKCVAEDVALLAGEIMTEGQGELTCANQCELQEQEGSSCDSPCVEHGELGHTECALTLPGFRCKLTFREADALSAAAQVYAGLLSDEEFRDDLPYRAEERLQQRRGRMSQTKAARVARSLPKHPLAKADT